MRRRNSPPLESRAVFEATTVGHNIATFQSLFVAGCLIWSTIAGFILFLGGFAA